MTTTTLDEPLTHQSLDAPAALPATQDSESTADAPMPSDTPTADAPVRPAASDSSSASTSADDEDDEDDDDPLLSLERDATDFDKATITVVLQLLPQDGHADGRLVLLGVKSHNLPPLTITRRFTQLTPLPDELAKLLTQWQHHYQEALAARTSKRVADKAKERAKEEERKRKQEDARRHAKTKPAASNPATRTTATAGPTPTARPAAPAPPGEAVPQSTLF